MTRKLSRKQKIGAESPPLKVLKRYPSQEYQRDQPGEFALKMFGASPSMKQYLRHIIYFNSFIEV